MKYEEYLAYQRLLARRASATLLDYLLFSMVLWAYGAYFGEWVVDLTFYIHGVRHILGMAFVWFLYFPVVESIWGYTLFKGVFDLTVVQDRKTDFPLWVSLKRHLLDPIDFALFGVVAVVVSTVNADHKRIGDMVARARVVPAQ
jgi:uncharacterized RDD family membrane protein YckC